MILDTFTLLNNKRALKERPSLVRMKKSNRRNAENQEWKPRCCAIFPVEAI